MNVFGGKPPQQLILHMHDTGWVLGYDCLIDGLHWLTMIKSYGDYWLTDEWRFVVDGKGQTKKTPQYCLMIGIMFLPDM